MGWQRAAFVVGGSVAFSLVTYGVYYIYQKRLSRNRDEGFEDTNVSLLLSDDSLEKRILVLGLSGSGKSTIMSRFSRVEPIARGETKPTEGFSVKCLQVNGMSLNIWEIGGADHVRMYWTNFLQDTDVLVFVVDSTDEMKFPTAFDELHRLLGDERLRRVPVLVIANKQDLPGAYSPEKVANILGLNSISPREHKICVLGTQIAEDGSTIQHSSILEAENTMISLCTSK